jgi:glycosyltransferase involved in cell wall biosynthesis
MAERSVISARQAASMTTAFRPPAVSVITIFYNASPYLAEAIDSVLAQEWQDFEFLLVDDGSTDGSAEIARSYAASDPKRIHYLQHPDRSNHGMSATRNLGLAKAKGEFIAFLDADDRWAANKLREQIEILQTMPHVDAVCGMVRYWRSWRGRRDRIVPTGHVQDRPVPPPQASIAFYPLGKAPAPCPSDLMMRRSAVQDVGAFEARFTGPLQMYEDQAFLAKFYLEKTIYVASRLWLDYRIHPRSFVWRARHDGRYGEVRRHFLEWLSQYLEQKQGYQAPTIAAAVQGALKKARTPRPGDVVRKAMSKLKKAPSV